MASLSEKQATEQLLSREPICIVETRALALLPLL